MKPSWHKLSSTKQQIGAPRSIYLAENENESSMIFLDPMRVVGGAALVISTQADRMALNSQCGFP
jgi:hypothetical protein